MCSTMTDVLASVGEKDVVTENSSGDVLQNVDGTEIHYEIIQEENKLQIKNEEDSARNLEELKLSKVSTGADDEGAENEKLQNSCKRLLHLLKRSKMYAAQLDNELQTHGMNNMRRRKTTKTGINSKLMNNPNITDKTDENDAPDCISGDDDNFFSETRLTETGFTVSYYQPVLLVGGVMRDYQLKGLQWLTTLFANGVNGILADEMGLGKTLQVIALICSLIESGVCGPFLVIAPLSTVSNWMAEFQKFAPSVPTMLFHGNKIRRKGLLQKIKIPTKVLNKMVRNVVITSYEVTLSEKLALSKIMWPYIIVDEGHRIKNHNSYLSRALRDFNAVGKLLVTGTPLQNNLSELWSLLNFIIPEVFNSLEVFQSWFDVQQLTSDGDKFMEEQYNVNIISTLQQIIIPFLLRREKKDVSLDLPPKREVLVYCPMTALQKKLYEATVDRSIDKLLNPKRPNEDVISTEPLPKRACVMYRKIESQDITERNAADIEKYREKYCATSDNADDFICNSKMQNPQMQLRKIVNHPYLIQFPLINGTDMLKIDEDLVAASGKLLVVDAMLSKLKAQGHKVILFSTFTIMLDILEYHAELRGYTYRRFDGYTPLEERQKIIVEFNTDPEIFLFLISIRAGGLGINLTGADTIIIYDSDWNPHINLQSQDRCHRIGQTKPVAIYKLCTRGTIDERIIEVGNTKRRLEKIIIQKGKFTKGAHDTNSRSNAMDLHELKALLSSTDYDSVIHSNGFVFTDAELEALMDRSDMTNGNSETNQSERGNNEKIFKLIKPSDDQ